MGPANGMAATSSWSALYFVALLVIGNFLVLNLFVAILLTNFGEQDVSTEYESTRNLLSSISFFQNFKKKGRDTQTPNEIETDRYWAQMPDKVGGQPWVLVEPGAVQVEPGRGFSAST